MKLTDEEQAMLAGESGPACQWAMDHMIQVGRQFDAENLIPVSQAHIMGDTEALGTAGVEFLEKLARDGAQVKIPMITDPRGVDLAFYRELGQTELMAQLERRTAAACTQMGILMTNTCICYQTVMPPVRKEHVAFGDTGVVIYTNSVLGAYSNFEGGPSALAAGLTGRTPYYGLHLDRNRRGTLRFVLDFTPRDLSEWGILGGIIGRKAGSYWQVPVIEGIDTVPTSDELKHLGAAMASYGSTPLFHIPGITPEADTLQDVFDQVPQQVHRVTAADHDTFRQAFQQAGTKIDVVVFAAPQLSLVEMSAVADALLGRHVHARTSLIACTSPSVAADCERLGITRRIQEAGGIVLSGTCFYQQFAREMAQANHWHNLLSNSAKIVNILGGYGYQPFLGSLEVCIESAVRGEMVQ